MININYNLILIIILPKNIILGKYHDLFVKSATLLLASAFENFQNICLEIYELDPARFLNAQGLVWQVALKETKVKLDI